MDERVKYHTAAVFICRTVLIVAGILAVHRNSALRPLFYGARAAHPITEVEAHNRVAVGMAVEADHDLRGALPAVHSEIGVSGCKTLHARIALENPVRQIKTLKRAGIVDVRSRGVAGPMILDGKRTPIRRPDRCERASDTQQHMALLRAHILHP